MHVCTFTVADIVIVPWKITELDVAQHCSGLGIQSKADTGCYVLTDYAVLNTHVIVSTGCLLLEFGIPLCDQRSAHRL